MAAVIQKHVLHYVFDSLCGWCYAAAPLVDAVRGLDGLQIVLHSGGMMVGEYRQKIDIHWRDYVMPHDLRIAQLTGQPFGEAYFEGLLRDMGAVMDSEPPTTAILAAEELGGHGLDMLHAIQHAHYVDGRRISDLQVLAELAAGLSLDAEAFQRSFVQLSGARTHEHFRASRTLLQELHGQGFPTLALESGEGQIARIDVGDWLGKPEAWRQHVLELMKSSGHIQTQGEAPMCDVNGCKV
ncbi:DsbA family protein [Uliginosibacterium gangwonense]|uniref:DsbA family protein n=1 Tax=Uliginosibacterium gangwonense TaxID=392736 RepID=UPI00036BAFDA|nr:DsbA family protein [Uliginosibacterium gangwonense]